LALPLRHGEAGVRMLGPERMVLVLSERAGIVDPDAGYRVCRFCVNPAGGIARPGVDALTWS
jgi:hypothetical protein